MINVPQIHLATIKKILRKYLPDIEVRAFGSRIMGTAKKYSDLDLVLIGENSIDLKVLMQLKDDFEESDIPFRVEIIDWHRTAEEFKKIIEAQGENII